MNKKILMADQTLFTDPDVFESDYLPGQFSYRDPQLEDLAFAVRPALYGGKPLNTVLRGLPGTGKTTCVRRIFAEIEETTKQIVPVYVNCQIEQTKYAVFAAIFEKLFGHRPPGSGVSITRIIKAVGRELLDRNRVLLVCLDDANYLRHDEVLNDTLYSILRLYENFSGVRSGVFATVSRIDLDFSQELDGAVFSVFLPTDVFFPRYGEQEVRGILRDRIRQGVYPNVVSGEMLDFIVTLTMRSGDLRVGLDLVKRAVLNAERDARTAVTREDVCAGYALSKNVSLVASVRTLTKEERSLLHYIADVSRDRRVPLLSGELFRSACRQKQMSYTAFYRRVKKLDEVRLINLQVPKQRGKTREIELRYDAEKVAEVCEG